MVSSKLTWSELRIAPSVTKQLDDMIFSLLKARWQKTAMMIVRVEERCKELGLPIRDQAIAACLEAIADSDRIDAAGDLRMWRHCEVRSKGCPIRREHLSVNGYDPCQHSGTAQPLPCFIKPTGSCGKFRLFRCC